MDEKKMIKTANNYAEYKANSKLNRKININKKKSIIYYIKSSINRYKKLIIDYAYYIHNYKESMDTNTILEKEYYENGGKFIATMPDFKLVSKDETYIKKFD